MNRLIRFTFLFKDTYPVKPEEITQISMADMPEGTAVTWEGTAENLAKYINSVPENITVKSDSLKFFHREAIKHELVKLKFYTDPKAYE